ncbi:MAG: hypothetical protein ACK559_17540, partial [bacterium]
MERRPGLRAIPCRDGAQSAGGLTALAVCYPPCIVAPSSPPRPPPWPAAMSRCPCSARQPESSTESASSSTPCAAPCAPTPSARWRHWPRSAT